MDELKPCPWCGQKLNGKPQVRQGSTFRWRQVMGCCTDGPEVRHDTLADDQAAAELDSTRRAIEAWNTRAASGGLNEHFGKPEQFDVNEQSGNSRQLPSLEQRARELLAAQVDDEAIKILMMQSPHEGSMVNLRTALRAITAALANQQGVAAGAYPTGSDREVLQYLMQQFDVETWQCPSCGHAEDTASMDSADYLRKYLAEHPSEQQQSAGDVGSQS